MVTGPEIGAGLGFLGDNVTDQSVHDLNVLLGRLGNLEKLVERQRKFIEGSGTAWSHLSINERDHGQRTSLGSEPHQAKDFDEATEAIGGQPEEKVVDAAHHQTESRETLDTDRRVLADKLHALSEEVRDHLRSFEDIKADFQARLSNDREAGVDEIHPHDLKDRLAYVESELRQRKEEIEQTHFELARSVEVALRLKQEIEEAHNTQARLQRQLDDANRWVFRLAGERAEREKQLTRLTHERDAKSKELQTALARVIALGNRVDDLNAKLRPAHKGATTPGSAAMGIRLSTPPHRDPQKVWESQQIPEPAGVAGQSTASSRYDHYSEQLRDLDALRQPMAMRDKQQFLERLQIIAPNQEKQDGLSLHASPSNLAPSRNELANTGEIQPIGIPLPPRNIEMERKLNVVRGQAEWFQRLSLALLKSPKPWIWALAPSEWRRKRLLASLKAEGIFDDDAYLTRHPDVAQAGVDPLRHYLKHGFAEGRELK